MELERQFAIICMSVCFTWALMVGYYNLKLEGIRALIAASLKQIGDHGLNLYAWTQAERDEWECYVVQLVAVAEHGWLPRIGATSTCTFGKPQPVSSTVPAGLPLKAGMKFCYTHRRAAKGDAIHCGGKR